VQLQTPIQVANEKSTRIFNLRTGFSVIGKGGREQRGDAFILTPTERDPYPEPRVRGD
jgi:hypothetical protein